MNVKTIFKSIISCVVAFFAGIFAAILFILGRRSNENRDNDSDATRIGQPTETDYRRVEQSVEDALEIIRAKKSSK